MSLTMRPATEADIDRLVDVYFSAFAENVINQRVFLESSPQTRPFWKNMMQENLKEGYIRFQVMETVDEPKTIAAFAIWNAPQKPTDPIPPMPPLSAWPSDGDVDAAAEFFYDLERQHKRYMGPLEGAPADAKQRPHWYLELIATHRDFQGRGAAGALLRYGEHQADAAGVPCYLDATPDGRPVYTSPGHGFREVETRLYLGGTYEHVFMIRDPRPSS